MLSCEELARRVAEGEPLARSAVLRLKARLHLWVCAHCRRYVEQLHAIGEAARSLGRRRAAEDERAIRTLVESVVRSLLAGVPERRS